MALNNSSNCPYLEQQTWVPVITGTSSAGTGTYTVQNGYWTRIGNMIFLTASITWTDHDGTGNMTITGLPFPARSSTNYNPLGNAIQEDIPLPGGNNDLEANILSGTDVVVLFATADGVPSSLVSMNDEGTINLSINYLM